MTANATKKVLIITYHYPPSLASGAVRPSKFAKYLGECGWQPTVLTIARNGTGKMPSADVFRAETAKEWQHPLKYYEHLTTRKAGTAEKQNEQIFSMSAPNSVARKRQTPGLRGLKRWALAFLWLPDREIGWLIPAVWRAARIIRQRKTTHLITTGPPFTCHLIGWILKRLTGIQWIADFRDPWSLDHKPLILRNEVTDRIEKRLIRMVMTRADRIVCVTLPMTEQARKEFPDLPADKFVTLTNGFDVEDFRELRRNKAKTGAIEISYLGTFYTGRTPEPLLRALQSLIAEGKVAANGVRVNFVGNVAWAEGRPVREMIDAFGLAGIVTLSAPISRSEALKMAVRSDIIVVLDEQHPLQIPLKLYEALAAGATVLNIGSEGATAEVVRSTCRGRVVLHTNQDAIKRALLECIEQAHAGLPPNHEPWNDRAIQQFNIKHLTRRLAELLDAMRVAA